MKDKRRLTHRTLAGFLAAGLLLTPIQSMGSPQASLPPMIEEQEYNGIPYLSGGIGLGEREALQRQTSDYNLKLIFALSAGNYLALVDVVIKDPGGIVLDVTSQGPWLFVKLPPGLYTVQATTRDGQTLTRQVRIPRQGRQEVRFLWKR